MYYWYFVCTICDLPPYRGPKLVGPSKVHTTHGAFMVVEAVSSCHVNVLTRISRDKRTLPEQVIAFFINKAY